MSFPHRVLYRTFAVRQSTFLMQTISINFQVPQGWHELGDKQLHYDTASLLCLSCKFENSCDRHTKNVTSLFPPGLRGLCINHPHQPIFG